MSDAEPEKSRKEEEKDKGKGKEEVEVEVDEQSSSPSPGPPQPPSPPPRPPSPPASPAQDPATTTEPTPEKPKPKSPMATTLSEVRQRRLSLPRSPGPKFPKEAEEPEEPEPPGSPLMLVFFAMMLVFVAACLFALGYMVFGSGPPSTFPRDFAVFTDREARLARKIPGDSIRSSEIANGRLASGVILQDMVDVLTQYIVYNPESMVLPIYYGEEYNYAALGFMGDRGPTVFLNPKLAKSSGSARITQQPRFCTETRGYTLPTRVVVRGSYHNSTTIVRQEFTGAHAALAYTMINQLEGEDVCDPEWE